VPTQFEDLVPAHVVNELIAAAEQQSVAMRLGSVQRMPSGVGSIPVVSVEPDAEWIDPRYGGRKKATTIEWTAQQLAAEELACVLAIPAAWIDDAGFRVWEQVRSRLAAAFAKRIDETLLFGVAPVPSSFPTGGIVAMAGAALTGADALEAIDKGLAAVEGEGLVPNGVASSASIGTALRQELRSIGSLPSEAPSASVYGVEVAIAAYWDGTNGDAIVGDWTKLVIGVREDITFDVSEDAIIQDASGAIIANAFQDDLVAMRCYIRMAAAIGRPVGADGNPVAPFAIVDWTSGVARETTTRRTRKAS
jgi:Phage capsid family